MSYIEPHGHMVSRTTDDYEKMALAGCLAICEPAFWAGFDRASADGFHDYFRQITEYEPKRAARFGLKHYSWLCINPKEAEDVKLADDVMALIPEFLSKPNVLGIGEIGLNKNSRNELTIFEKHVQIAEDYDQLILIHTRFHAPSHAMHVISSRLQCIIKNNDFTVYIIVSNIISNVRFIITRFIFSYFFFTFTI